MCRLKLTANGIVKTRMSPIRIFISFFILSLIGAILISKLSINLFPDSHGKTVQISYNWRGASPLTIENTITTVLEARLSSIKGIKKIESKSSLETGIITMEFEDSIDLSFARLEISSIIRQVYKDLPESLDYPVVNLNSIADEIQNPLLSYNISSNKSTAKIHKFIKTKIEPVFLNIPEIEKIKISGETNLQTKLTFDNNTINNLGISKQEIINSLKRNSDKVGLG